MSRVAYISILLLAVIVVPLTSAEAEVPGPVWSDTEAIASGVPDLSSSSGSSAVFCRGRWWVTYAKNGDVYCADRDTLGGPLHIAQLTSNAAVQRQPYIAANNQTVYVVWEDHEGAHPEIWGRSNSGSSWQTPVCLSCDATASLSPVIHALTDFSGDPYVAWMDSTQTRIRIMATRFSSGVVHQVSAPFADARDPSVCDGTVVWSDSRHGVPQIYKRAEFEPEARVTVLPFPCRRPVIRSGQCQEFGSGPPAIFFEGEPHGGGIAEIYEAECDGAGARLISADDGIPSNQPNLDFFQFPVRPCYQMPGMSAHYLVTWTDQISPGVGSHRMVAVACCGAPHGEDILPPPGLSHSAIAVTRGCRAACLQLWIEDRAGVPTLVSRAGRLPGSKLPALGGPPAFLVSPEGLLANTFRFYDSCSGEPEWGEIRWSVDQNMDHALTWDPEQYHADYLVTDEQGEVTIGIRAGGCAQTGSLSVSAGCFSGGGEAVYPGVKSPDADGNCIVNASDLAFVESRLGTDEFCADLDGSGLVGAEDVAIVQATMGQHCSNVPSDAPEEPVAAQISPAFGIFPNPCHERAVFEVTAPKDAGTIRIDVVDVGGRRVRSIDAPVTSGGRQSIRWDLRDEMGHAVASGIYVVVPRFEGGLGIRSDILVVY